MADSTSVFERAKSLFQEYAKGMGLEEKYPRQGLLERLTSPDKTIILRVSLQRDDGSISTFDGYRVQFNDDLGPYKGGLRFHPRVNLDEVTALAFWMYLKTALLNLPFGGAKGGITVDYKSLSLSEKERLTKRFAVLIAGDIGEDTDIPAPDVNTSSREMAWMLDAFRMRKGEYERGIVTGKPIDLGGSLGRTEATGFGCVTTLMEAAGDEGIDPQGAAAAIQGFGNAGQHAARKLVEYGTRVVAVADTGCTLHDPGGLDVDAVIAHKKTSGRLVGFPGVREIASGDVFGVDCDFLIPAALEDSIDEEVAHSIRARVMAEAANGPTTREAAIVLRERGIRVVPDILASAGGVVVSYFEWVQNRQEYYWSVEEVQNRLAGRLIKAYRQVADRARERDISLRRAAYELAAERVAQAAHERGVQ